MNKSLAIDCVICRFTGSCILHGRSKKFGTVQLQIINVDSKTNKKL